MAQLTFAYGAIMKKIIGLLCLAVILAVSSAGIASAAEAGLSIFVGMSDSDLDYPDGTDAYDGTAFGVDYQINNSESFTINPFYMLSNEDGPSGAFFDPFFGTVTFTSEIDTTILGAELRFWFDSLFVGPLVANFDIDRTISINFIGTTFTVEDGDSAIGFGAVAGWEAEGGIFLKFFYGMADLDGVDYTTTRLFVGWRF